MPTSRLAFTNPPASQPASGGVAYKANSYNCSNATSKVVSLNGTWKTDSISFTVDPLYRYTVHVRNSASIGATSINIDYIQVYGEASASYLTCSEDSVGYRFGFNNMEKDDEIKGMGNSYDFGVRIYDPRLGRWLSTDALASKYPAISPFVFALNTPIMAKDPDGNVVIFINGQHEGSGGTAAYWGGYDNKVMDKIGDHSARYVDGALGGWKNTGANAGKGAFEGSKGGWIGAIERAALKVGTSSNVNMKVRIAAGHAQGMKDAADIIANLKEGETIKIVTHSMGTGFARGYTEGILKYAKKHGLLDKVKFEYELDVNSFQGGDLPADKNVLQTQNKTGGLDGGNSLMEVLKLNSVPTVDKVPGAEDTSTESDKTKGHAIGEMSTDGIPYLGNEGGRSARPIEQGSNNEKKP